YKRMNKEGAISGMVTGLLLMLFYMTKFKFGWFGGGSQEDWWFGVSPEGFGTFAMLVNFIVSITVCQFTSVPPKEIQELVEKIRIPTTE
ncbi:MAG: cation acetate symporter, partial [Flavobacteriaceae bacterium]|nr:cation acetate symporter [Flavobacteriaceae bacterium]